LLEIQSNKTINNNNNDEDKSELTKNFCFFMNLLQNIQNLITNIPTIKLECEPELKKKMDEIREKKKHEPTVEEIAETCDEKLYT